MSKFLDYLQQVGRKMGTSRVFSDFLTFAVCCLSAQEQEEEYLKTAKPYSKDEMMLFSHAFAELVQEMDNNGTGLKDCLGDYFMEFFYNKNSGQFFTPESLCDLMVQLLNPEAGKPINDPCCGSGRYFLSVAKLGVNTVYYGADIDYRCCQMTLINMCLNGLYGVVSHQNTLSLKEWNRWEVKIHPKYFIPYIHKIDLQEEKNETETIKETKEAKPTEETKEFIIIKNNELTEFLNEINAIL